MTLKLPSPAAPANGRPMPAQGLRAAAMKPRHCTGLTLIELVIALAVLAALGGREVAAMTGAMLRARTLRIPVILDGFIACAAAAILHAAAPGALDHCIAGHSSAEAAHGRLLAALGKTPLLNLGLRLGEGSGAARWQHGMALGA